EPAIDLVFAEYINVVAAEDEVAKESQGLFAHVEDDVLQLFPVGFQLLEGVAARLHEQQIFEQVHRVETHATVIDGLENLQRFGHILGLYADQSLIVDEIVVVGTQRCGIISKLLLQEGKRHRVGIPDIGYRQRACADGAIEGPLGDAHENVAAVLVLEVESISKVITACPINRSCRNLMTKRIRGRLTKSLEPVANG